MLFWDFLDKLGIILGIVLGIITVVVSSKSFFMLRKQRNVLKQVIAHKSELKGTYEELRKHNDAVNSEEPMALCISLITQDRDIKASVTRFLRNKGGLYAKMPIEELNMQGLHPENLSEFVEKLRVKRLEINDKCTELHLFLQVPIMSAVMIGAMFDNWKPVKLYQWDNGKGEYEYWTHLVK